MEHKQFREALKLIDTSLLNQVMDRTYNSIGSNVFFEFGKAEEISYPNGRKWLKKEWSIWLSWVSWRITKDNSFVVGSGDDSSEKIQEGISRLLGRCLKSYRFVSQFLDIEFNFDDGYRVSTFFNKLDEYQWSVFTPKDSEISINCSSLKEVEKNTELSRSFKIHDKYNKLDFLPSLTIDDLLADPTRFFRMSSSKFLFEVGASAWRIQKDGKYYLGSNDFLLGEANSDQQELKSRLFELQGKRINSIFLSDSKMDVKFILNNGYSLEFFTNSLGGLWKLSIDNDLHLIPMLNQ